MFFLENRTIPTNTIHDSANTIQAYTLTHMLHERGRVSMTGDKATNGILYLDGHFAFPCDASIIHILSAFSRGNLECFQI